MKHGTENDPEFTGKVELRRVDEKAKSNDAHDQLKRDMTIAGQHDQPKRESPGMKPKMPARPDHEATTKVLEAIVKVLNDTGHRDDPVVAAAMEHLERLKPDQKDTDAKLR